MSSKIIRYINNNIREGRSYVKNNKLYILIITCIIVEFIYLFSGSLGSQLSGGFIVKDGEFIRKVLVEEIQQEIRREEVGANVFKAIGDSAPAFGMFGTLVGLIQMLSNMTDPSTIGPAMAVAMLTTLYGVLLSQLLAYPISEKLTMKIDRQTALSELILECIVQIQQLQNPTALKDILEPYLPGNQRKMEEDR